MSQPSQIIIEETFLGVILLAAMLIFMVMSFIFAYHWRRFVVSTAFFLRMKRLYLAVSVILALISIFLYTLILSAS